MTRWIYLLLFFSFISTNLFAQYRTGVEFSNIVVVNGGVFGSSEYANIGVYNTLDQSYTFIDTMYETSVQDLEVYVEGYILGTGSALAYAYVAAQDSIYKFDVSGNSRAAANAFGSVSTRCLDASGDYLLVGNWYGSADNNLRIFDKETLAFIDSVPGLEHGVGDILVENGMAYVTQNVNDVSSGFTDTLGHLVTIDLITFEIVSRDTLSTNGDDLGRLVLDNGIIYGINPVSNTISSYNINTGGAATLPAGVDVQTASYGETVYRNELASGHYFPFDGAIGIYDLSTQTVLSSGSIAPSGSFAYVVDDFDGVTYVSTIDFLNQNNNAGTIYITTDGSVIGDFPVGYSPELLGLYRDLISSTSRLEASIIELNLFPNPVQTQLQVHLEAANNYTLQITNAAGQIVNQHTFNGDRTIMEVAQLPAGTYFMSVYNEGKFLKTSAFVKQ